MLLVNARVGPSRIHGLDPNTVQRDEGGGYPVVYAKRDVMEGEEITCDYNEIITLGYRPWQAA